MEENYRPMHYLIVLLDSHIFPGLVVRKYLTVLILDVKNQLKHSGGQLKQWHQYPQEISMLYRVC